MRDLQARALDAAVEARLENQRDGASGLFTQQAGADTDEGALAGIQNMLQTARRRGRGEASGAGTAAAGAGANPKFTFLCMNQLQRHSTSRAVAYVSKSVIETQARGSLRSTCCFTTARWLRRRRTTTGE